MQFKKGGFGEGSGFANNFAPENSGTSVVAVGSTGGNNIPTEDMNNAYEAGDLRKDYSMASSYIDNKTGKDHIHQTHKEIQGCALSER